ncbi:Uncharacterised protein r2_g4318 [Pycnogonum litorale]
MKKEKRRCYVENCILDLSKLRPNSKDFWQFFRPRRRDEQFNEQLFNDLTEHFKIIFNPLSTGIDSNSSLVVWYDNQDPWLDCEISTDEIYKNLKKCKMNGSPGIDCITFKCITDNFNSLSNILHHIFNYIFVNSNSIPVQWTLTKILPVFKGGKADEANNYRPISLLSCLYKLYSRILNTRLYDWCESNEILNPCQYGFRKHLGTVEAIFNMQTILQKYAMVKNGRIISAFVDFKNAFDRVDRSILCQKLINSGISRKFVQAIMATFSNNAACVSYANRCSESFPTVIGVKQGDVISPFFFLCF